MVIIISIFLVLITIWLWVQHNLARLLSVTGLLAIAVYWRISSWNYPLSLCIDEAEWLALASRLRDCAVPFQCYNGSTTGFLSIGLLNIFPALGMDLSYFNLRVFGFVACIIPASALCYFGIRKWYDDAVAKMVFPWLAMFMTFGFYNREFLAYNTEYLLMLLYAAIFYMYALWKQKSFGNTKEPILMALLLGVMPYVKLQSVPFVFAWYVVLLWKGWRYKTWSRLLIWNFVLASATVLFAGYFMYKNILTDFYRMYIESNAYYVNHRITSYKYSDNEFIHRLRAFKGMHITTFMPLYLGLLPLLVLGYKQFIPLKNLKKNISWLTVWVFLWVCYSTYTTGNGYGHYNVLLIVPVMFLVANLYHIIQNEKPIWLKWLSMAGLCVPIYVFSGRAEIKSYHIENSYSQTEQFLKKRTSPQEPVLIMGWEQALEVQIRTLRKLPVRNATYQYISIGDSSLRAYYQNGFFADMLNSRPRYVVDMEEVLEMPGLLPVKNFIHSHYRVDTLIEGNVIYTIKN